MAELTNQLGRMVELKHKSQQEEVPNHQCRPVQLQLERCILSNIGCNLSMVHGILLKGKKLETLQKPGAFTVTGCCSVSLHLEC